jgi:site-specific DNA-adenine methylase
MDKPFKSYNGGKESDGTFQKIINIMPPHNIYIEGFLGNGAIFRKKKQAPMGSILIDLDAAVISEWQYINQFRNDRLIELINTDAISWLENFKVTARLLFNSDVKVLIYLDPPYLKETRKSDRDLYKHELSLPDHIRLLEVARSIKADVIISHYPDENYDRILNDWNSFTFQSQTRKGTATEKVWFNFDRPSELHDYRYLGETYRERERIKGIIFRNVSKLKRMRPDIKAALIHQLKESGTI